MSRARLRITSRLERLGHSLPGPPGPFVRRCLPVVAAVLALAAPGTSYAAVTTWGPPAAPGRAYTAVAPQAAPARGRYDWPTPGPAPVIEGFRPPAVAWGAGHRGVDLRLAAGSPVRCAGDGVVAFAGVVAGRPVVSVDHADGIRTTYEPVEPQVQAGQAVSREQVLGTLLSGHRADGVDALHWGARTGRRSYINPLRLLRPAVIRLKPLR